ncbi:MAG: YncE family protein [Bacteroidota bacterium]|nr:YncE family protein [Bacteroidota bacterium]
MKKLPFIIIGLILLSITSCMRDDELWESVTYNNFPYEGLFVINEGNFMYNNASLTYYDLETKDVIQNVFFNTNGIPLGDVAQSMTIRDSLAYIVLNNSGKIMIMNINNFRFIGKITELDSPRQIHFLSDDKAYVSDLYAQAIHIVNPKSMKKIGSIDISNPQSDFYQHPSEEFVQIDSLVFTNAWSFDNQILVINSNTDELIDSIQVGKQPNSMCLDNLNRLWVLSDGGFEGNPYGNELASLTCINTSNLNIIKRIELEQDFNPTNLCINASGDSLFFINHDVCFFAVHQSEQAKTLIESTYEYGQIGGFYSLAIDRKRKEIYVGDAKDNVQAGTVSRYSGDGNFINEFDTGIIPGSFCFKETNP